MKSVIKTAILLFVITFLSSLILGCQNPLDDATGCITLNLKETISKTLVPDISMEPASYTITGTGPGGVTFEESTTSDVIVIEDLVFGEWIVTVTAYNNTSDIIGTGTVTTSVNTGQTTTVEVPVTAVEGTGTLDLTVNWTESEVTLPSITATLTPAMGEDISLTFAVGAASATNITSGLTSGYYTLTIQLLDNSASVMGLVEVVWIAADQTTTSSFDFTDINSAAGSLSILINPQINEPLDIDIIGGSAKKTESTDLFLIAETYNYIENVTYVWYVNGVSVAANTSYTFDNSWLPGYYRIDCTGFNNDGSRAGSDTLAVEVVVDPPPITPSSFITTWKTDNPGSSASNQIQLPLDANGIYDFAVFWGDGKTSIITQWDQSDTLHTFQESGTYDVVITGTLDGWSFMANGDCDKLINISQWGTFSPGTMGQIANFQECKNLTITTTDVLDLSGIEVLDLMFAGCSSLTDIPNISLWDTSNVQTTFGMFDGCTFFNGDVRSWDTSSIAMMMGMFQGAASFNQDLSGWEVYNVLNMENLLLGTAMSETNYDLLINSWASQPVQPDVSFGCSAQYTAAAEAARTVLTDTYGWNITDGGLSP